MKVTYDKDTDTLAIRLNENPIVESDEEKPGVIIDFDKDGNLVGIEVLDASRRVKEPTSVEFHLLPSG
jgi:uncharacterized protein YuzE